MRFVKRLTFRILHWREALAFIEDIRPEKAYLTHISHLFGRHEEIEKLLPENVYMAYDGLELEIDR